MPYSTSANSSRWSSRAILPTPALLLLAALAPLLPAAARPLTAAVGTPKVNATVSVDVFSLHSAVNGLCLSYYPGSDGSNTKTSVGECRPFQNTQSWFLGGPGVKVKSAVNSYCLTVCQGDGCHSYRDDKMTQVVMSPCQDGGSMEQNWVVNAGVFMTEVSGDCLTQCTTCTDYVIVTYPCAGLSSQMWHELPATEGATALSLAVA